MKSSIFNETAKKMEMKILLTKKSKTYYNDSYHYHHVKMCKQNQSFDIFHTQRLTKSIKTITEIQLLHCFFHFVFIQSV